MFKKIILMMLMVLMASSIVFASEWEIISEYDMETIIKNEYPTANRWGAFSINDNGLLGGRIRFDGTRDGYTYNIHTGEITIYDDKQIILGINNSDVLAVNSGHIIYPDGTTINVGVQYRVYDINDFGISVGYIDSQPEGFIRLIDGTIYDVHYPGSLDTGAKSINNQNIVVGWYFESSGINHHGFVYDYDTNTYTDFRYPGAVKTTLSGINDDGTISGFWYNSEGKAHSFIYRNGIFEDFVSTRNVWFQDINQAGEVLGIYDELWEGLRFIVKKPLDATYDYTPNTFKLLIRDQETKLITTGSLVTPEDLDLTDGKQVDVEVTIRYKGLKSDGGDLIIIYDDTHEVKVNNQNSINVE